ncbi:MAG: hypothetical protein V4549_07555 [Bacteroidota bacterium]
MDTVIFTNGKFTTSDKSLAKRMSCLINETNMSRSTVLKKELPNGDHLVCIIGASKEGNQVVVTFADGKNKQIDKSYDFNSSEFIKMCHSAGTIKDKEVFNSLDCIGKTLWATVQSDSVIETNPHIEGLEAIPFKDIIEALPEVEGSRKPLNIKAKETIIKEAREMIKSVESGATITKEEITETFNLDEDEDSI